MRHVFKTAVSLAVLGNVGPGMFPDGSAVAPRSRRFFILDVDRLSWRIRDRIVGPGRDLIFAAVQGPGVPRAQLRNLEAERLDSKSH